MPYVYVGQVGSCVECSTSFPKTSPTKVRCEPCQVNNRRRQAEVKRAKFGAIYAATAAQRRADRLGRSPLSEPIECAQCGSSFVRKSAFGKFCPACQEKGKWARLPQSRRDQVRAKRRVARRSRQETDPVFALNKRMSAGVLHSLKTAKGGRKWEHLVGYTTAELMRHLERQFLPRMGWENRHEWHVDHIQPLAGFTFTGPDDEEFQAAWALSNLRPLWKLDNIRKNSRRTHLL